MKINFLLILLIIATVSSCSTSYKTGQTPDDVYYSPARLQNNDVRKEREENNSVDNSVYTSSEDREIRRRVHNRRYRRYDDRYNYPYGYDYPYGYNYPYNNYPVYVNPKSGAAPNTSQPRKTNLGAYKPNTASDASGSYNPKLGNTNNSGATTSPARTFGTPKNSSSNNGSAVGNFIRRVFPTDNNSNNKYNNNYNSDNSNNSSSSRTFESRSSNNNSSNNSNTNSSSNSNSSSNAPVRTFKKDN